MSNPKKLIAVVGATGQQGGGAVRALQATGQFQVRALTRDPAKHPKLADEVVAADLNRSETLKAAFAGAHGVFLVTNAWEAGEGESKQALAAVNAAKEAGVHHLIWSTLPNVEKISGGKIGVPHFTEKAEVDRIVTEAGFAYHTFVIAPFYYQNLLGAMAPQKQADGTAGWALPLDPTKRVIHMGDITEIGRIVAGAFAQPELAGQGEHLPLVGDFLSFNEIVATLGRQGNKFSFKRVPLRKSLPDGSRALTASPRCSRTSRRTCTWGTDSRDAIALANVVAGQEPTKFAAWARTPSPAPGSRLEDNHHRGGVEHAKRVLRCHLDLQKDFPMKRLLLLTVSVASLSAFAAQGAKVPGAEKYDIDASHSGVVFGWNHFGFSNPTARFDKIEGGMLLDKADLTKSSVVVTLPVEGLDTRVEKLDEVLKKSPEFFDSGKYPTITFKSTKVEKAGENGLKITGDLTVHGVTKPVTLDAKVNKIGLFEIPGVVKAQTAGFDATTVIRRSDFGVTKFLPAVSDEIPVRITLDAKLAQAQ